MASLVPYLKLKFFSKTSPSTPLAAGYVWTYVSGTTTPLVAYHDAAGNTPWTNPIVLDDNGEALVYLGPYNYDLDVFSAQDVEQELYVGISGSGANSSVISVTNIVDLKALPAGIADSIYVRGYYTAGDGGGGIFNWDATNNSTPDNGVIIVPDSVPPTGRWIRSLGDFVDPLMFGAKNDGTTNASTAYTGTIAYATAHDLAVHISTGPYRIDTNFTIPSNSPLLVDENVTWTSAATVTYTINGPIVAPSSFRITGTNVTVALGVDSIEQVPAEWFKSFNAAKAAIGDTNEKTLVITTHVDLTADVELLTNIQLQVDFAGLIGGAFTLIVDRPLIAGDYQIFDTALTVNLDYPGDTHVSWFAADPTDYAYAFNAAFATHGSVGNKVVMPNIRLIPIKSTIGWTGIDHINFDGFASSAVDGTVPAIQWKGSPDGIMFQSLTGSVGCKIKNLVFDGQYLTKLCMDLNLMRRSDIYNVTLTKTIGFIRSRNCYYSSFQRMLYFLQTPGTFIGGGGQCTLNAWLEVCNNSAFAPIQFTSNANNMLLEHHSFSRIGGYENPAGAGNLQHVILLTGQNQTFLLPAIESIGMNTVDETSIFDLVTGPSGPWATQLTFPVLSGVSAANSSQHILYGKIITAAGTHTISLYSDSIKTALVAEGARIGNGIVILNPKNSSGIRGQLTLTYTGDSNTVDDIINWDYDTVNRLFFVSAGACVDVNNVYMEAVNVNNIGVIGQQFRTGAQFHDFYMEDCNFRGVLFDSSGLHDLEVRNMVGLGCTVQGIKMADESFGTHLNMENMEFHNRFLVEGGVNYSDETLGLLGMASTVASLPIVYRPEVQSGLGVLQGSDVVSTFILVAPGVIKDGLGMTVEVGIPQDVNALTTPAGWLFRPDQVAVKDYNVVVDAVGAVYVEDQLSLKGTNEQGKIIIATFHTNAGVISALTIPAILKSDRGITTILTGGISLKGGIEMDTDLVMDATDSVIRTNSSDASDTKRILLCGGGSYENTRGGRINVHGNEYASNGGGIELSLGNIAGAQISLITNGSVAHYMNLAGDLLHTARHEEYTGDTVAAANDLTLGIGQSHGGNHYVISGNGVIHGIAIAGWQSGSQFTLQFSGNALVEHNTGAGAGFASLWLNGNADFTTRPGMMVTFRYDGSKWYEVSRSSPPVVISSDGTVHSSVGATSNLAAFTIPANSLLMPGDVLHLRAAGTFANNANAKAIVIDVAGSAASLISSSTYTNLPWSVDMYMFYFSATSVKCNAVWTIGGTTVADYHDINVNMNAARAVTFQAFAVANADIVQQFYNARVDVTQ